MSNALRQCEYHINQIINKAALRSSAMRNDTRAIVKKSFSRIHALGLKVGYKGIKQKHIIALMESLKAEGLSERTRANYLSKLRWYHREINRPNAIHYNNSYYGVKYTDRVPKQSRAITEPDLSLVKDDRIRLTLELQYAFALRRCEVIKFNWQAACQASGVIALKGSWTKGGIPRSVSILSDQQQAVLDKVIATIPKGESLIPPELTYIQQVKRYEDATRTAGLKSPHGLRHGSVQKTYFALTNQYSNGNGWQCPFKGGPLKRQMTDAQKKIDKQVRIEIARMLGHQRLSVSDVYLGKNH